MDSRFAKQVASLFVGLGIVAGFMFLQPRKVNAIPAFSRQYGTSCTTCHVDFPKLNDFGKAFKDAGFKFPADDETYVKVQPVMLGSPAQKELWPKTVWPGTIPGIPQIGLRMNTFFQALGKNRNNLGFTTNPTAPYIPSTDFAAGYFSIFTAGNFGSDIAFWVDNDLDVSGSNSNGHLGDGYLKFHNVGRFAKLPKDSLSLRVGQFELDLPFTQARSYNLSGYDVYAEKNIGTAQQFVNNGFAFTNPAQGVEVSGGHSYGGYHYSLAVVNQNTSGTSSTGTSNVFPANGVAFSSDSNFKDIYGRLAYRFNLERDKASRNDVQAAGAMGPRDHTSLRLGSYAFYGRSVQRILNTSGTTLLGTDREPFYRVGGDVDFHYRQFNLYGLYMYAHDHDVLPVINESGALTGFVRGTPATFGGGFVQADYLALPWLMTIMRWDAVNSPNDRTNGNGQYRATRNRFTPGVQFLIHANIKTSFEYQVQPQYVVLLPGQSTPTTFRGNAAVAALEWVY